MALAVKDLALSLLWLGFRPWPGNFCMLLAQPKIKKNKTKKQWEEMQFRSPHPRPADNLSFNRPFR